MRSVTKTSHESERYGQKGSGNEEGGGGDEGEKKSKTNRKERGSTIRRERVPVAFYLGTESCGREREKS